MVVVVVVGRSVAESQLSNHRPKFFFSPPLTNVSALWGKLCFHLNVVYCFTNKQGNALNSHLVSSELLHPFNGLFFRLTWVSRYQKDKTSLDLNEARNDGVLGCSGISWTICQ